MDWSVQNCALLLAGVSFATFVIGTIGSVVAQVRTATVADQAARLATSVSDRANSNFAPPAAGLPSVHELTDLVKSLTGAIDSIVKAGPALAGLVASVLFLGIAAWASVYSGSSNIVCSIAAQTPMEFDGNKLKASTPVKCEAAPPVGMTPKS